jgi:hypothetical protein
MRFLPTIKDSRGEESVTLLFVTVSWLVLTVKFALSGLAIKIGTPPATVVEFSAPLVGAGEYGIAFAGIVGIWLGREYQQRRAKPKAEVPNAHV